MSATTQTTTRLTTREVSEALRAVATEGDVATRTTGFILSVSTWDDASDCVYVQYLDVDPQVVTDQLRAISSHLSLCGYAVVEDAQSYLGRPNGFLNHLTVTRAVA